MKKTNRFLPLPAKINGWILVASGLMLFTGQLQKLSAWGLSASDGMAGYND